MRSAAPYIWPSGDLFTCSLARADVNITSTDVWSHDIHSLTYICCVLSHTLSRLMSNQAAAMIFYCSFYLFIIVFFFF